MGQRQSSFYRPIVDVMDWTNGYVIFEFGDLRVEIPFVAEEDHYRVDISDKVRQRIIDGERGWMYVFCGERCVGKVKIKSNYWKQYELDIHPTLHYHDYIPAKQSVNGLLYKIRHSVANYPQAVLFYEKSGYKDTVTNIRVND